MQEHCFIKELSVSRCIHFCLMAECLMEQMMKSLLSFKSINTSLKNCMIVSIQKEETKLQKNVRKRQLRSTTLCSKRSAIHIHDSRGGYDKRHYNYSQYDDTQIWAKESSKWEILLFLK